MVEAFEPGVAADHPVEGFVARAGLIPVFDGGSFDEFGAEFFGAELFEEFFVDVAGKVGVVRADGVGVEHGVDGSFGVADSGQK